MEALIKLSSNVTVKVDGANVKELLENITSVDEALGYEPCGKCKSNNTKPQCRTVGDDKFYEIKCQDCGAVLQLGSSKDGEHLYKKKMKTDKKGKAVKDDNDKAIYLPDNGWLKWNPATKEME